MSNYRLIASKSTGSMIVEAALALGRLPYDVEMIPYGEPGPERERLLSLNPLGQVPTLLLPDGHVMTESAAIKRFRIVTNRCGEMTPLSDAPIAPLTPSWSDLVRPSTSFDERERAVAGKLVDGRAKHDQDGEGRVLR